MRSEVKFCENNFLYGIEEIINRFEENFDNIRVDVEPCLGYCGECSIGPFALVNENFIEAENSEDLYKKIVEELDL